MKRILIPYNNESSDHDFNTAIKTAVNECKSFGSNQITLITAYKNNLCNTKIGEHLGSKTTKDLLKGIERKISNEDIFVTLESVKTVSNSTARSIGIAIHVADSAMVKLDDMRFDCLIFVPCVKKEGKNWANKWDAETPDGDTNSSKITLDPKIKEDLIKLTQSINLSTGLGHKSDIDRAKNIFKNLCASGRQWDPMEIEKWAVRNNWTSVEANKLSELSKKYLKY